MDRSITISDISDKRLAVYKSLEVKRPDKGGIFITESKPAVKRPLESNIEILSCVTTKTFYEKFCKNSLWSKAGIPPSMSWIKKR